MTAATTAPSGFTESQQRDRLAMHRGRKRVNVLALVLSLAAMAFGVFWLLWILFETFRLGVGQVIRGWDDGIVGMKEGGCRRLHIPSDLAYGERGAGAVIKPGESLVFVVDLVSVR